MADFRVAVSDSKTAKAYQVNVTGTEIGKLIGKSIGDTVSGDVVGLPGYTIKLTGGTDKDGFPMRGDLPGPTRRKILVAGGVGYKPKAKGVRKRKTMRGNEISSDISQVNAVIVEYGPKSVDELFGKEEAEAGEEAKSEEPVEEVKTEGTEEAKAEEAVAEEGKPEEAEEVKAEEAKPEETEA